MDFGQDIPYRRLAIALAVSALLVVIFLVVRQMLLERHGRSFSANAKYVGTGAAFRAANLSVAGLQTSTNPYLKQFRGMFTGTALDGAFPASGAALVYAVPGRGKAVAVPGVAAQAWDMVRARRAADELTPESAAADLAALVAKPDNVAAAASAVLAAYNAGVFSLSATRYQPSFCCDEAKTCPVGYATC